MSEDGVLPKMFQKKLVEKEVMPVALTVFAALCLVVLFFANTFEAILNFTIFLDCIGMAASAASIFKLRKQAVRPASGEIYSMRLFPVLPIIFIAAYVFVAVSIAIQTPKTALTGIVVLLSFMLLYYLVYHRKTVRN